MSNHDETVIRIIGLFLSLLSFWFIISFSILAVASFFDNNLFTLENILYSFLIVLLIRVFYPRFIFSN